MIAVALDEIAQFLRKAEFLVVLRVTAVRDVAVETVVAYSNNLQVEAATSRPDFLGDLLERSKIAVIGIAPARPVLDSESRITATTISRAA